MATAENMARMTEIFKALSDETRLKIIYEMYVAGELSVSAVAERVGATVATTSHHLRMLEGMKLAKKQKLGKQVFYSLDDHHVAGLIELALEHSEE